jgi:hypothetical protein
VVRKARRLSTVPSAVPGGGAGAVAELTIVKVPAPLRGRFALAVAIMPGS